MATVETVLLSDNDRHRAYTGVDKFHKAGYYGQRVKACSGENWSLNYYNPGGLCVDPLGIGTGSGHAVDTAATFFQVAPKAKLYMLYSTNGRYGTTYDSKFFEYSADVIEKEGINNMFVSLLCSRVSNRSIATCLSLIVASVLGIFKNSSSLTISLIMFNSLNLCDLMTILYLYQHLQKRPSHH